MYYYISTATYTLTTHTTIRASEAKVGCEPAQGAQRPLLGVRGGINIHHPVLGFIILALALWRSKTRLFLLAGYLSRMSEKAENDIVCSSLQLWFTGPVLSSCRLLRASPGPVRSNADLPFDGSPRIKCKHSEEHRRHMSGSLSRISPSP